MSTRMTRSRSGAKIAAEDVDQPCLKIQKVEDGMVEDDIPKVEDGMVEDDIPKVEDGMVEDDIPKVEDGDIPFDTPQDCPHKHFCNNKGLTTQNEFDEHMEICNEKHGEYLD
jgi:hypothetical protein